jgi:hypothetical protein
VAALATGAADEFGRKLSELEERYLHGIYAGIACFWMNAPVIREAQSGDESAIHEAHMRSIRDVKEVTLESTITAHEFYRRLGFRDCGPVSWTEIAGYPVRYFPMKREL